MPTNVIMPALEMAQETGKVLHWLKSPGDTVQKGDLLVEIETDKVTVEIEAPASGVLREVTARAGDVVPVGQTIALIFAPGEAGAPAPAPSAAPAPAAVKAAPDVLAHVARQATTARAAASPKARRLAAERGLDIRVLHGSGPGGAILAADVAGAPSAARPEAHGVGTVWRIMAERMTASWTTAPHFYLVREVTVSRLVSWLPQARKQTGARITYTDLLVRLVAATLARHPGVNASWKDGAIVRNADINIGLAVAIDDGLVVPVLHRADTHQQPRYARRGRLQRHRQPAPGRHPRRRPHRRPRRRPQRPAGRPADPGADALLRPPRPRRRAGRAVPRRARRADRGAAGATGVRLGVSSVADGASAKTILLKGTFFRSFSVLRID
ncbi:MAG: 2-oxo acid dehydrogenase subunit E2 [Candidatus Rokubacteria bacterium]|nr:2-oxo acid dehydrogenase subunit E2 [Candidatus Rokubacteria bacterium]